MKKIKNCIAILLSTVVILPFSNKSSCSILAMDSTYCHRNDNPKNDFVLNFLNQNSDTNNDTNSDSENWSLKKVVAIGGTSLLVITIGFLFYSTYLKRGNINIKNSIFLNFNKNNKEDDDKNKSRLCPKII